MNTCGGGGIQMIEWKILIRDRSGILLRHIGLDFYYRNSYAIRIKRLQNGHGFLKIMLLNVS